jgi:hypothetical protein
MVLFHGSLSSVMLTNVASSEYSYAFSGCLHSLSCLEWTTVDHPSVQMLLSMAQLKCHFLLKVSAQLPALHAFYLHENRFTLFSSTLDTSQCLVFVLNKICANWLILNKPNPLQKVYISNRLENKIVICIFYYIHMMETSAHLVCCHWIPFFPPN